MQFEHYAVGLSLVAVIAAVVWTSRKGRKASAPLSLATFARAVAPPPVPEDAIATARKAMRAAHEALQEAGLMMSITAQTDRAAAGYAADHNTRIAPLVGSASPVVQSSVKASSKTSA